MIIMKDDGISRRAAIEALRKCQTYLFDECDPDKKIELRSAERAIEDLPSAQRGFCEYCNEDVDGFVTPLEKNGHAFIRFGMNGWELSLRAKGWHGSAKIRYCPMCGRDLYVK